MNSIEKYTFFTKKKFFLANVRLPGLEPGSNRWQRSILPLNHRRFVLICKLV